MDKRLDFCFRLHPNKTCVLKVNMHCEACKMQMIEVLRSVIGEFDFTIDAARGLVRITAEVDPDMVLSAIARTGKHAELVYSSISHPQVRRRRQSQLNNSLYHYNHPGSYPMGGYPMGGYPMVGPNYGNHPQLLHQHGYGNMMPMLPYARQRPFESLGRNALNLAYY